MLGVRLHNTLEERLNALSKSTHRPKSYYVKAALQNYLDEYETLYHTIQTYEMQKKNGTLQTTSLDDLMQENSISEHDLDI